MYDRTVGALVPIGRALTNKKPTKRRTHTQGVKHRLAPQVKSESDIDKRMSVNMSGICTGML